MHCFLSLEQDRVSLLELLTVAIEMFKDQHCYQARAGQHNNYGRQTDNRLMFNECCVIVLPRAFLIPG